MAVPPPLPGALTTLGIRHSYSQALSKRRNQYLSDNGETKLTTNETLALYWKMSLRSHLNNSDYTSIGSYR